MFCQPFDDFGAGGGEVVPFGPIGFDVVQLDTPEFLVDQQFPPAVPDAVVGPLGGMIVRGGPLPEDWLAAVELGPLKRGDDALPVRFVAGGCTRARSS